jgi:hypothetical protein
MHGGAGQAGRCNICTADVVKDVPLPEFKLDLSTLSRLFAPVRPLRPARRAVTKVQVWARACGVFVFVLQCVCRSHDTRVLCVWLLCVSRHSRHAQHMS